MIAKLIWKEWREHRWKLGLGCVVLATFTFVGLRTRLVMDQIILVMSVLLGGFGLPIFAGMDLVAAERGDGTLGALLRLPCRAWRILAVKTATGAVVCVVPILLAGGVAGLVAGGREMPTWHVVRFHVAAAGLAVTVLVWMLAFGMGQPSEARTAVVGVAVLIVWVLMVVLWEPFEHSLPDWVLVLHPGSFLVVMDPPDAHWLAAVFPVQMALTGVLYAWATVRFARLGKEVR